MVVAVEDKDLSPSQLALRGIASLVACGLGYWLFFWDWGRTADNLRANGKNPYGWGNWFLAAGVLACLLWSAYYFWMAWRVSTGKFERSDDKGAAR